MRETQNSLLLSEDIRDRYQYPDQKAKDFVEGVHLLARRVAGLPLVKGVSRDPNDDHVIACALAAGVSYLVTRDKDLLTLKTYQSVEMIRPEEFIHLVRTQTPKF